MQLNPKELSLVKTQTSALENKATSLIISNEDNYKNAITILAKIKEIGKIIKIKKEAITKPLSESLKNARDLFRPLEDQFINAEKIIKTKMLKYKSEIDKIAKEKEEQIAKRAEKGTIKLETAERKMNEIERINKTTQGKFGKATFRQTRKVRIINQTLIPLEYLVPNMTLIRTDALSGKNIPGVEVYIEDSVSL